MKLEMYAIMIPAQFNPSRNGDLYYKGSATGGWQVGFRQFGLLCDLFPTRRSAETALTLMGEVRGARVVTIEITIT